MVPLSLQRGKRVAFFTFVAIGILMALWCVNVLKLYRVTLSRTENCLNNYAAGRDEWVLPDSKMAPELYKVVRPGAIYFVWDKLISQTSNNFAAGRDGWIIPSGKMPPGCTK